MIRILATLVFCLIAAAAYAQQSMKPPPSDTELQQLLARKLQAELELTEGVLRRREAEWAEYSKSLWQKPEAK